MKTTQISTSSMTSAMRLSLAKTQLKLAEAQKEVTTGRHADVGAALGYKTGQALSLRQEHARLKTIIDSNSVVSTRLSATQAGLQQLTDDAQLFVSQLIGARIPIPVRPSSATRRRRPSSQRSMRDSALEGAHCSPVSTPIEADPEYYATPVPAIARRSSTSLDGFGRFGDAGNGALRQAI